MRQNPNPSNQVWKYPKSIPNMPINFKPYIYVYEFLQVYENFSNSSDSNPFKISPKIKLDRYIPLKNGEKDAIHNSDEQVGP